LAYADEYRAAEVLATLQRLRTGSVIDEHGAVSVVRATDWSVKVHYGGDLRADAAAMANFWRSLIASLLLAPDGSAHHMRLEDCGLDVEFAQRLGAALPPGSSAVFMLVPRAALSRVLPELHRFGGTLLQAPIERAFITRLRGSPGLPTDHAADES
jgi:uncharacterized membrane protein